MSKKILSINGQFLAINDSLIAMPEMNLQDKTVTPQQNAQVVVADAAFTGLNKVTVEAMPIGELGTPTISEEGVITISATTSGYIASGISKTLELPTQEAQTIMPTTADQIIPSQKYLVGNQTIKGDANLVPENIAKDVVIFGITGTHQGGEDVSAELTEQDDIIALMQEAIATKSAAGVAEPFAFITVTYPEGSVCTCTDGTETLTAKNTDGTYVFCVPHEGEWTVTSTDPEDSTKTKSQIVEITEEGQLESVTLSYQLVLFENGVLASGYNVTDKLNISDGYLTVKVGSQGTGYGNIKPAVDVTNYSTMKVIANVVGIPNTGHNLGLTQNPDNTAWNPEDYAVVIKNSIKSTDSEYSFDLSALSGEYYFRMGMYSGSINCAKIIFE